MNLICNSSATSSGTSQRLENIPPSATVSPDAFALVLINADTAPCLSLVKVSTLVGGSGAGGTLAPITGSPEGVTTASPGTLVWDAQDAVLYVKATGTGNTGWLATV